MLQLSHFKLLAGVVFALFILTACGGSDSAAPAAATNNTDDGGDSGGDTRTCTDAQFDNGTACVAKITAEKCNGDGYNGVNAATNTCIAYTQATCESASKFWTGTACEAKITSCTDSNHIVVVPRNVCEADRNYVAKPYSYFDDRDADSNGILEGNELTATDNEYSKSKALVSVNTAQAYVNIENLIKADNNSGAIKQGGEGQVISVLTILNPAHSSGTTGYNNSYDGLADSSNAVFVDGYNATSKLNTVNVSACAIEADEAACKADADSKQHTHNLNGLAGRKEGTGIHGIAYNAKIKMLSYGGALIAARANALLKHANTVDGEEDGANIIAMIYDRPQNDYSYNMDTTKDVYNNKYYVLPETAGLDNRETAGLKTLVGTTADSLTTNDSIIVTYAGKQGANSINGMMDSYDTAAARGLLSETPVKRDAKAFYAGTLGANKVAEGNEARFSTHVIHADYIGRWIVAVGVDANNVILPSSNGCGAAKQYCLSVPEIASVADGTMLAVKASYTLAGAFAVMQGAFPTLDNTQLISLALGTADYIEPKTDDDGDGVYTDAVSDTDAGVVTSATNGKYNAIYGHGLLNLQAATSLSAADAGNANIITSSASPIGALWGDTNLTLSSHFGNKLDSVNLGVQDKYGRHFVLDAQNSTRAPVAVASLDEYMANILADNVQSETLGGQAKLNYSNTAQPWMNLEYVSGKATSKIAFQDNYKVKPLHNDSAASMLRANHIRPASHNIGMMDVDYQLSGALSLSSYAARGEYDTGYKFDELGTDFDVNYKKSHLNIAIGNIREHDQFLGTHTTGGYALNAPTVSRFTDVTYGHDVGNRFNIYANYINYETDVDMLHDQFASIDGLQADQYQVGFTGKSLLSDDDNLNVALITKLGVTDGALNQNTTLGYTADGAFNDVSQSYDLAVSERHQQFEITYQGKIYQNSQDGVSVLKDNRFFTTIRVDQNLNHVQGAGQTEIVSGVSARF